MSAHTLGPWQTARHGTPDYAPQFGVYANAASDLAIVRGPNAEANARLIAAAPDLLAALQTIADSEQLDGDSFICDFDTLQSVAREAIRKATT